MAKQGKTLPARRPRGGAEGSLLLRSAESLGRVIGTLQRQLDGASKRLTNTVDDIPAGSDRHAYHDDTSKPAQRKRPSAATSARSGAAKTTSARPTAKAKTASRGATASKRTAKSTAGGGSTAKKSAPGARKKGASKARRG